MSAEVVKSFALVLGTIFLTIYFTNLLDPRPGAWIENLLGPIGILLILYGLL